jgi:hypothetical protein
LPIFTNIYNIFGEHLYIGIDVVNMTICINPNSGRHLVIMISETVLRPL